MILILFFRGATFFLSKLTKLIDFSFSCVCPVIDHEFRHNIVKVAADLRSKINSCVCPLISIDNNN